MLETFFLLSLAITFLLVIFLVYHFKNRISTLEHKCDTMFEIINGVASELGHVRNILQVNNTILPVLPEINHNQEKITVSLSDDEPGLSDSESEYETDGDNETDSDDEADGDDEADSDDEADGDNEADNDDEADNVHADGSLRENDIKLISVKLNGDIDNPIESNESDTNIDTDNEHDTQFQQNDTIIDNDNEHDAQFQQNEDLQIIVEKLIDENNHLDESSITSSHSTTKKSVYKKMTLQLLKSLVIEKGIMSDPSKLKKHELIELIESTDI